MISRREKQKKDMRRRMISAGDSEDKVRQLEYQQARRNRVRFWLVFGIIAVVIIVIIAAFLMLRYHRYTTYELKWEREMAEGSFSGYEHFGENVIRYSHDGASYIDKDGNDVWVDTYEMSNPKAYVSGDYACIYDAFGTQIRIYNLTGSIGTAATLKPVTKAVVAESGVCAAIIEDNDAAYITFFRKDGSDLDITIKSRLEGDGYPIDIALSPEGTQLISAFEYLDGGVMKSKVVFYDFSEIGKNVPNRLVGGFEEPFAESMVARVRFINSTYSYAAADTGIYIFSSRNISSPELVNTITTGESITSIVNAGNHLGVVYTDLAADEESDSEEPVKNYRLVVYNADGSEMLRKEFDEQFDTLTADGSYIYLIGNDNCTIMSMNGIIKFSDYMEDGARMITHGKMPGNFIFSGNTYMRAYQFK